MKNLPSSLARQSEFAYVAAVERLRRPSAAAALARLSSHHGLREEPSQTRSETPPHANPFCLVFLLFFLPAAGFCADDTGYSKGVLSTHYAVRAPARLGQGFVNTLLGWTSLFTEPVRARHAGKTVPDSFFRGLAYPISYTVLGVWDLGTFWVPGMMGYDMAVPLSAYPPPIS